MISTETIYQLKCTAVIIHKQHAECNNKILVNKKILFKEILLFFDTDMQTTIM